MMKKAAMYSSASSSFQQLGGEARTRFKHQGLLQDYEELLKETEVKKRKLQRSVQKKFKLRAEVKFLRRKYNSFSRNLHQETPSELKKLPRTMPSPAVQVAQPLNATNVSDLRLQDGNQKAKKAEIQRTSPLFDLNKVSLPNAEEKEGIQVDREATKGAHDLNMLIFRGVGNGSGHVGKRKISWKDQIALRV